MPTVVSSEAKKTRTKRAARAVTGPRRDPDKRPVDFSTKYDAVANKDPERFYVKCDPNSQHMGQAYYESIGYQVEIYTGPESPHFRRFGRPEVGKPVVGLMGQVLMSIDAETHAWIEKNGIDGSRGQAQCDRRDARMLKNRKEKDGFRGLAGDLGRQGYVESGLLEGSVRRETFRLE